MNARPPTPSLRRILVASLLCLAGAVPAAEVSLPNISINITPEPKGLYLYSETRFLYEDSLAFRVGSFNGLYLQAQSQDGNYFPGWAPYSIGDISWPAPTGWRLDGVRGPFVWDWLHTQPSLIYACRPGRNYYKHSLDYYPYTGDELFEMWDGGLFPVPATSRKPYSLPIYRMIKIPGWLEDSFLTGGPVNFHTPGSLRFGSMLPSDDYIGAEIEIPVLQRLGISLPVQADFEYESESARWELTLGAGLNQEKKRRGARPKRAFRRQSGGLYIGNRELEFSVEGSAKGTASESGIHVENVETTVGLSGRFEGGRYGLLDLFPVVARIVDLLPFIDSADLSPIKVIVYLTVSIDGTITLQFSQADASLADGASELKGCVGIELETHANLLAATATLTGGG